MKDYEMKALAHAFEKIYWSDGVLAIVPLNKVIRVQLTRVGFENFARDNFLQSEIEKKDDDLYIRTIRLGDVEVMCIFHEAELTKKDREDLEW